MNTTNKPQPFRHRRGKNFDAPDEIRAACVPKSAYSLSQFCRDHRAVLFEHTNQALNFVPTLRIAFKLLAEGLIVKKDRGDKTPLELFLAGVRGWEASFRRILARQPNDG